MAGVIEQIVSEYGRIDLLMGPGTALVIVVECEPAKREMSEGAVRNAIQPLREVQLLVPCHGCGDAHGA